MYVANTHLKPVIGIDIHFVNMPFPFVPLPHPYIGLVIDPFDYIPFIGATVKVNGVPRGNTDTMGMIITFVHIPFGAGFTLFPMIGHDSQNFFGSKKVMVDGAPMSGAGYILMTCNDIGLPLSFRPGKKFKPIPSLYLPTSFCIPLQWGAPVHVGGPLVPNFSLMALLKAFAFGSFLKVLGKFGGRALRALSRRLKGSNRASNKLKNALCRMGFEPVDLVTGRVNYEYMDFELPGPIPIQWRRNWDSDSEMDGLLGHGTQLCYDRHIELLEEEEMLLLMLADGRMAAFPLLSPGEEYYHRQEKIVLRRKQNGHFLLDDYNDSLYYHFNLQVTESFYRLTLIENYSGQRVQLHYHNKHLHAITDSAGRQLHLQMDNKHRITGVELRHRDMKQQLVSYTYNTEGDLTVITDALGQQTVVEFSDHLMTKKTDRNGQRFYWEYDEKKRCIHTAGDGGILEGWISYEEGHNIVTNSLGEITTYWYDENNLCIQETDHYGNSVFTSYTEDFDIHREIDEQGMVTGYIYDEKGILKEKVLPDGNSVQFHYTAFNKPDLIIYPAGNSETYGYDEMRRLRFMNYPNGQTVAYEYNDDGQLATITQNGKRKTKLQYDNDENVVAMELPNGAKAEWSYDAFGRCTKAVNPEGLLRHFEYDALDRLRKLYMPDGNILSLEYNAYRQVTTAADRGGIVQYEYSPMGQIKKRKRLALPGSARGSSAGSPSYAKASAGESEIQFYYDTEERLRSIVNESGKYYYYGYNKRGEVISETGFDGVHREYERDVAGKVIRTRRPGERHTLYEYDANGRIIKIEYHDGSWEHFRYDRNGQLIEAGNEHGIIAFTRTKTGLIETEQQGDYFIKNIYDRHGNRSGLQSSLGAMIELQRNDVGLVNALHAKHSSELSLDANWSAHYHYNLSGQEMQRQLPGNITSSKEYDHAGRPSAVKVSRDSNLQSWKKYTWQSNDRLSEIVDAMSHAVHTFRHDALGNLVFAQYADGKMIQRETDELGNVYESRDKKDRNYNAAGALLQTKNHRYKYDECGNMISKTDRATQKKTLFEWYANGMLKKVVRPDGRAVCFKYDALGRRIEKTFNGMVTRFVWDGNVPLHEWSYPETERPQTIVDEWGQISVDRPEPVSNLTTWIFDADSFVPAARMHNGKTNSIIADYMGTPSMMFDENGQKVWEAALDIYGRVRTLEGERSSLPFRYQGQYEDVETGLYYNRFRYYAPEEGLYISQDPIGLLGNNPNIYAYTHDPQAWLDVLGLAHDLIGEIVRNNQTIFSQPYQSGGVFTGQGSPNQQQALLTHTERKFLNDAMDVVEPGDHLKMTGELNPCKPGCQPAIRDFVLANNVTAEYHATSTNQTYHWERVSDKHVIQTEMVDGKVTGRYKYSMHTRRRRRRRISCN